MTVLASRPSQKPQPARRMSLTDILTKGKNLPSRIVFHGVEGVGKTSTGAEFPGAVFLMARGETGLETLIDSCRIKEIPHFPEAISFDEVLGIVDVLINENHQYKTLVIDTLNGIERLCHEMVCSRNFGGDWSNKGFSNYQQGYDVALSDWSLLLSRLDTLREKRSMGIVCLCHTKISLYKNPEGEDYDRYTPELHHKTWGITKKWADMILFANHEVHVDTSGSRAKGKGGTERMIYTERTAAWDAKNRHGLPTEIPMGNSSREAFANLHNAIKQGRMTEKAGE